VGDLRIVEVRLGRVKTLGHLVTDESDETFKNVLNVDVLLGRGLEELYTCTYKMFITEVLI